MGNINPTGIIDKSGDLPIEDRIGDLKYAELFIGVSSGLSWLAFGRFCFFRTLVPHVTL